MDSPLALQASEGLAGLHSRSSRDEVSLLPYVIVMRSADFVVASGLGGGRCEAVRFGLFALHPDFDNVRREEQGKRPVGHDAEAAAPARHLKQIVRAADKPRRK